MNINPQSQTLFKALLISTEPMDAKQLAKKLGIFPNSVYRLTQPLVKMGLITQIDKYPYQFKAKPIDEGLSLFLLSQNNWFLKEFSLPSSLPQQVSFSFIQSRDELMNLSAGEIIRATKTVNLLRSGHEIPAEVMLALIEAKKRGVITRMLIQDYSTENKEQVINWQRNGILVRQTPLHHIRLMLYDCEVIYFMSYKNTDSQKDLGMKINFPPFAVILSQLFEQWWDKADVIE